MPTIDKKHINDSIQKIQKRTDSPYISKEGVIFWVSQKRSESFSFFARKTRFPHPVQFIFGKKRRNKFLFPFSHKNDLFSVHKNEIIRDKTKEDKPLARVRLVTRYLDILNLSIKKIKFKETTESYLIEFLHQGKYFLIEFFYDNDIVLLIRNNENGKRRSWDFTMDQTIELLQTIEQNIIEDTNE